MAVEKTRVQITNSSTSEQTVTEQDGEITAFEVTGLTPSTTYTAEASVMVNGGWLAYTQLYTFTTLTNYSATSHPVSYDTTDYAWAAVPSSNPISNGYAGYTSSTWARFNLVTGANAETYIYYNFDLNIPTNAVINSVVCRVKCFSSTVTSSRVKKRTVQLYSGSTAKGATLNMEGSSTNPLVFDGDNVGNWTATELNSARLKLYSQRGTSNTTTVYYFGFYGATLEVNYSA